MKLVKLSFILAVAVMAIIGISTTSYAFHGGGVANCESCHTMHNSFQTGAMTGLKTTTVGAPGTGNAANSAAFLLRGTDQSSACLNCHERDTLGSYRSSTPDATISGSANKAPVQRTPAGDFGWLRSGTGTTGAVLNRRGHNIVAVDFGYTADTENTIAPGGTFDATKLNCISCHNPHNQLRRTDELGTLVKPAIGTNVYAIAGSGSPSNSALATVTTPMGPFRFLRGAGADQAPKSYSSIVFTAGPPDAMNPNTYNRSEDTTETHVAYGAGMSQWCGNCHAAFYDTVGDSAIGNSGHPHPTNVAIGATKADTYNAYKGSGDLTGSNGYTSLVPVEMGTSDYSLLRAAASSTGGGNYLAAVPESKVMCLSCHRAHASGFQSMTRFNVGGNTTASNGTDYVLATGMVSTSQALAAYYEIPATKFTANTKQLCNKCHAKD